MDNTLLLILTIIGSFAIYWVVIGQSKYNKMMADPQQDSTNNEKEVKK